MKRRQLLIMMFIIVNQLLSVMAQQTSVTRNSPFSVIRESQSGEYLFVLLSQENTRSYMEAAVDHWKSSGFTKPEMEKFETDLQRKLDDEIRNRMTFRDSGLYRKDTSVLIFKTNNFPAWADEIYISNEGRYVIGVNRFVTDLSRGSPKSTEEAISRVTDGAFVVHFNNATKCEKKLSDILKETDRIVLTSDGFYWANKDQMDFDNRTDSLKIQKLNGDSIVLDAETCRVSGERPKSSVWTTPQCGGIVAFIALTLLLRHL